MHNVITLSDATSYDKRLLHGYFHIVPYRYQPEADRDDVGLDMKVTMS